MEPEDRPLPLAEQVFDHAGLVADQGCDSCRRAGCFLLAGLLELRILLGFEFRESRQGLSLPLAGETNTYPGLLGEGDLGTGLGFDFRASRDLRLPERCLLRSDLLSDCFDLLLGGEPDRTDLLCSNGTQRDLSAPLDGFDVAACLAGCFDLRIEDLVGLFEPHTEVRHRLRGCIAGQLDRLTDDRLLELLAGFGGSPVGFGHLVCIGRSLLGCRIPLLVALPPLGSCDLGFAAYPVRRLRQFRLGLLGVLEFLGRGCEFGPVVFD